MTKLAEIKIPQFITHVEYTNNKVAPNKFKKINNQSIYNSNINRFSRNILVKNLHKYIGSFIPKGLKLNTYPVEIKYTLKSVINHGDISRRGGNIIWKYPKENYVPRWDIENCISLWIKCGNDTLTQNKVIVDDSIQYVNKISYEFIPVENFEDREITIKIYKND